MIEKRYVLAALAFFSTFNVYSIRNGITGFLKSANPHFLTVFKVSIMDMANIEKNNVESVNLDQTVCPMPNRSSFEYLVKNNTLDKQITWSESQKSDILGAYFIGYRICR